MDIQELLMTAARTSVLYFFLLVMIRLSGKRTIGNFTAFDLIVALMIGEVVDEPIFGDVPMVQGMVAIAIIAGWHYVNAILSYRSRAIDELTGGKPTELVLDGKMQRDAMAKERINEEELWSMLREQQIEDLRDVKRGTLEMNGVLSVIRTREAQEAEKRDLQQLQQRG